MYAILLLSSLLHITTCTVHIVTPDDHYYPNITCHHCHNLQHYLLNITKYFTSNTELLFLPGLHHLHTDLIIQNVHNISLIGSTANGTTLDTVIQCYSTNGILMTNITNLNAKNITITDCTANFNLTDITVQDESYVVLYNCFQVCLQDVTIKYTGVHGGLLAFNILGKFTLESIRSEVLRIAYNDSNYTDLFMSSAKQSELSIHKFQPMPYEVRTKSLNLTDWLTGGTSIFNYDWMRNLQNSSSFSATSNFMNSVKDDYSVELTIKFDLLQTSFNVSVMIKNSNFKQLKQYATIISFTLNQCLNNNQNVIFIQGCQFENNLSYYVIYMSSSSCSSSQKSNKKRSIIKIRNCQFIKNRTKRYTVFETISIENVDASLHISECLFQDNLITVVSFSSTILQNSILIITKSHIILPQNLPKFKKYARVVIFLLNTKLIIKGPVFFHGYNIVDFLQTNTIIEFHNYVEFSNIDVTKLIHGTARYNIHLVDNAYINITNNIIGETIFSMIDEESDFYPSCYFQYFTKIHNHSRQVIFMESNKFLRNGQVFDEATGNINCKWDPASLYYGMNPLDVYKTQFHIAYELSPFNTGLLCYCLDEIHPNCYTNTIMPLYPGQTLSLYLALNPKATTEEFMPVTVKMFDEDFLHSLCSVSTLLEAEQPVGKNCTKVVYNIFSENQEQCKLVLYSTEYKYPTVYYINLLNCPAGFSFDVNVKKCVCDQKLKSEILSIDSCSINDQTILRPANSWISATTHNHSYTYHISSYCPFYYCLPHSSHLNLSTPNSQCQFNRSGLLCGHCQQGLSTVFGSSYCHHCFGSYFFLAIVIAVTGVVLIFLLYILNLTIVGGSINAFVFYVNVVSMNVPILFPKLDTFTPAYTFISLANLDLGIQTCFYNGMDDYAKMWLQLAFPFYLIFIATLIIITSHYSTTIQRLTARRALPVLATLFLLSYTKILRIVSNVLFFYSTITHLPSKHTTLVWSVDANVPLFGVRFTLIFIVCLLLFLLLMLFNIMLLCIKILPKLNMTIKFKSLSDAYRFPYKDNFYYWTGLQLAIRAVFFGISSLERSLNLTVSIVLLGIIEGVHCIAKPYKNKALNYQELLFVLNALWLYTYILFVDDDTDSNMIVVNAMIAIAAGHFTIIIIYHIITYAYNGVIMNKIQRSFNILAQWATHKYTSNVTTN